MSPQAVCELFDASKQTNPTIAFMKASCAELGKMIADSAPMRLANDGHAASSDHGNEGATPAPPQAKQPEAPPPALPPLEADAPEAPPGAPRPLINVFGYKLMPVTSISEVGNGEVVYASPGHGENGSWDDVCEKETGEFTVSSTMDDAKIVGVWVEEPETSLTLQPREIFKIIARPAAEEEETKADANGDGKEEA